MNQVRTEAQKERRRKVIKFVFFSVLVALVPFFGWPLDDSELYFVSVGILAAGTGEILFDRKADHEQKWQGRADLPFVLHVSLSLLMCLWGALEYGKAEGVEAAAAKAARTGIESTGAVQLPVNIPPGVMLAIAVILAGSATIASVNVPRKVP